MFAAMTPQRLPTSADLVHALLPGTRLEIQAQGYSVAWVVTVARSEGIGLSCRRRWDDELEIEEKTSYEK